MNPKVLSNVKTRSDFSFCFPYLASLEALDVKEMPKESPPKKRQRCQSAGSNRQKTLLKVYGSRSVSQKQVQKVKVEAGGYSSMQASLQIKGNKSNNNFRNNFNLHRRSHQIRDKDIEQHLYRKIGSPREAERFRLQSQKKPFLYDQALFTEPLPITLPHKRDIPGVKFKQQSTEGQDNASNQLEGSRQMVAKMREQHSRGSKQDLWQRQRRINIDSIINFRCKEFQSVMDEYYRRTQSDTFKLIFLFDSQDTWMKNLLLKRGWAENKNKHSKAFHLLWTYRFPVERHFPEQWVNHFPKSFKITTKGGLHQLLQAYQVSHLQPQTFDLDRQTPQFVTAYHKYAFASWLFNVLACSQPESSQQLGEEGLLGAMERHLQQIRKGTPEGITVQLSYIIEKCCDFLANKQFRVEGSKLNSFETTFKAAVNLKHQDSKMIQTLRKFNHCLRQNRDACLQGGDQNIWIVKSKISSKAAGTFISNNLGILTKNSNRIVQKYIENILLLPCNNKRKFDIRLWVLLVGTKQPRLYYYKQFYCRSCSESYALTKQSLKNQLAHLTNYSLQRQRYSLKDTPSVLFYDQLFREVNQMFGMRYEQVFYGKVEAILRDLKPIFLGELCKDSSNNNYFELFGLDLIIDCKLDLHLLEINLSARCEERDARLTSMLEGLGEGLLDILDEKSNIWNWTPVI